jgi:protein-disulfide isomerase
MTLDPETETLPAETPAATAEAPARPARDPYGQRMRSAPVVGVVMLIVGLLVGYYGRPTLDKWSGLPTPAQAAIVGPQPLPQSQDELMPYLISQTRHFKGNPNAPVTLIEFADFQCPFCGLHAANASPRIHEQYVATGKVRLGFQHFAFLGPESQWAAEASECAADQNAFWEYHDYLYAHQNGENQGAFNKDKLKEFAAALGLNAKTFDDCLDSGKHGAFVTSQTQALGSLGVQSTPTFVLNGRALVGAQNFEVFQQMIEQELSK